MQKKIFLQFQNLMLTLQKHYFCFFISNFCIVLHLLIFKNKKQEKFVFSREDPIFFVFLSNFCPIKVFFFDFFVSCFVYLAWFKLLKQTILVLSKYFPSLFWYETEIYSINYAFNRWDIHFLFFPIKNIRFMLKHIGKKLANKFSYKRKYDFI